MTNLAENLKALTYSRGISANQLAKLLGMAPSSMSRLLISGNCRPATLYKLARIFSTTTDVLTRRYETAQALFAAVGGSKETKPEPTAPADVITMNGGAMRPLIEPGDLLKLDARAEPRDGDVVYATPEGSDTPVVRRLMRDEFASWLVAINPDYLGEKTLKAGDILAVVTARTTSLRK